MHNFYNSDKKEVTRIDKNAEKITKIYPTFYNLLIAQNLGRTHSCQ